MLFFAIDDERAMLAELCDALADADPAAEIRPFNRARPALQAIEKGERPDVIFSDIELPGIDGLALSAQFKEACPQAKIVFVTAYPNYAVEAFRLHVDGFIVKPVDAERVREELDALFDKRSAFSRLYVRCFGSFEVFLDRKPMVFPRKRCKELFAFLVDRAGGACSNEEIITALLEDTSARNKKAYLRVIASDLRVALEQEGLGELLVREHGQWAVRRDLIDCDYFRLLDGHPKATKAYRGEYMRQYSWAEPTAATLYFNHRHDA